MKALVLFSGGLDSSVCLGLAVKEYGADEVLALSIYYGQKHKKEMQAAEKVAKHYGVKLMKLDLGAIFAGSNCSLLEGSDEEIPHEDYAEQLEKTDGAPVSTYVPFRNGLFLSSAASVALSHGCEVIYYGAHADDAAGNAYPDTSMAFNKAISDAIFIGSGNALRIEAPFIDKSKADVVAMGIALGNADVAAGTGTVATATGPVTGVSAGVSAPADTVPVPMSAAVPFELTWSCYEGHEKACGVCGTCRDRLQAFAANNMKDPIEYEV